MPAANMKQQRLFAIAEHSPAKLFAKNKSVAKLPHKTLHEFAATKKVDLGKALVNRRMKGRKSG